MILSHSLLLVDSHVRCRDSVRTVSRRTREALMRDEEPRRRLPRIQPRPLTAPMAMHLHHPTTDPASVSALPVPSDGQDTEDSPCDRNSESDSSSSFSFSRRPCRAIKLPVSLRVVSSLCHCVTTSVPWTLHVRFVVPLIGYRKKSAEPPQRTCNSRRVANEVTSTFRFYPNPLLY